MNTGEPSGLSSAPQENAIGDQNVERLLTTAYQPESVDPEFVQRIRALASDAAKAGRGLSTTARPRSYGIRSTTRWWFAIGSTALAVLLVAGFFLANREFQTPEYYPDGELIWIDGRVYAPVKSGDSVANNRPLLKPLRVGKKAGGSQGNEPLRIGERGLTPRRRVPDPLPETVSIGDSIATKPGQRRSIELPDKSILYLNENASVTVDEHRRITVAAGEIFVEASPAASHGGSAFVVKTPGREVTALGTKLAVSVDETGTDVAVTQGKVRVSGIERLLLAGQQLRNGNISPLPRASDVLHWTRELMAEAESPLVPASEYGGGALVAIDPDGQQTKLSLRKYHVDVYLEDGIARTTIDQSFFNHLPSRLEGTFYFPLPPDASISRLAMYVNGRLMEGGMAEREHARNVFETIKYRSLDPALLEWVDGSTFKMRVFPLEGREEKRLVLSYTQKLDNNYGRMQYRFPAGHNMDLVRDWSVKLHVERGAALRWNCPSHSLEAKTDGGDLTLTSSARDVRPDRDIVVGLSEEPESADRVSDYSRFSTVDQEGWRYLMLRFRPELEMAKQRARRDWVFLVEADGSRDPLLARVQVDVIKALLQNAEHDDTFSIVTAATRVHAFAANQQPATSANIAAAAEFLDKIHLIGALNLEQAITAAGSFARAADRPVLVHLGSGIPILGEREVGKLVGALPKDATYVGVGVGKRWNRPFMKGAASRTGGVFTQINPDEPIKWRAFELGSSLNTPRLMDLRVEAGRQEAFLAIKDWVSHGEEFCAVARFPLDQSDVSSVTVSGSLNGQPYRRTVSVGKVEVGAEYLPRLWAKLAIDEMVARDADKNKSQIVELSKSMYVMSPFTSLLVLENDAMYEQYKVDRGRKDHWARYPCPETIEVVREPLRGPQSAVASDGNNVSGKPSVEEVLKTLLVWNPATRPRLLATDRLPSVVDVPDGGSLLLGSSDWANPPAMITLPYSTRLFKNDWFDDLSNGIAEFVDPLMLRVTPRIIIQEEEEQRLAIDNDTDGIAAAADFDSLIKLINSTISPVTWDTELSGDFIEPFPASLSLVVSQTQHVQRGHSLLRDLYLGSRAYPVGDLVMPITQAGASDFGTVLFMDGFDFAPSLLTPTADVWQQLTLNRLKYKSMDLSGRSGTSAKWLMAALNKTVDLNYRERPLTDVIDDIAKNHGIPIVLKRNALEESGIEPTTPVTIQVTGRSLKSALARMLEELDLTYFIADEVLQITTFDDDRVASASYGLDEMLLLMRRRGSAAQANAPHNAWPLSMLNDPRQADRWAKILTQRLSQGVEQMSLLYLQPPAFTNRRTFHHLVHFAPAITTTRADVLAVLEEEAELRHAPQIGTIDERARELIEAARSRGWQRITLYDRGNPHDLEVAVDGRGRFRLDHQTEYGLEETIVCDGETLRHLYPELGLGAIRRMSRFHRAELARLVPWLLPTVEDLATGADLRVIGRNTIAIAPHGFGAAQDRGGQPRRYVRLHLVFAEDGRLAERRVVEMPSGRTTYRVAYAADGTIRWFDGDDLQRGEMSLSVETTAAPDLQPIVDELVILPMPVRERNHVYQLARTAALSQAKSPEVTDALQAIANRDRTRADDPAQWNESDALRLLATNYWQNPSELREVIGRRFFARSDRRLGFYTLLLSAGERWNVDQPVELGDGTSTRMDPLTDHPHSLLARYIDSQLQNRRFDLGVARQRGENSPLGFIPQLAEFQQLRERWSIANDPPGDSFNPQPQARTEPTPPGDAEVRRRELDELFDFISRCDSPNLALFLLRRVQQRYGDSQPHGRIADALVELEKSGTSSYVVKYELARSLASRGEQEQAQSLFVQLYRETLGGGILPPIDESFRAAIQKSEDPFGSDDEGEKGFSGLMRGACARLIEHNQRPIAIALAWQCRQLNDAELGDVLVDRVLTGVPDDEQLGTTLAAVEYLVQAGKYDRVDALLAPILSSRPFSQSPALWRLASQVAVRGERLARSVSYLERAMNLEYESLPKQYDVEQVRARYGQLFASYQKLAGVVAAPDGDAPVDLVGRSIKAADRWRSLDTDVTVACHNAAKLLNKLGRQELAWDYLTTPLAMKPNEAAAWLALAKTLRDDEELELADRAYASAFQAEPTNAQILWDRAQLLERAGRAQDGRALYRQIAEGQWQPRFDSIKRQAERITASRP